MKISELPHWTFPLVDGVVGSLFLADWCLSWQPKVFFFTFERVVAVKQPFPSSVDIRRWLSRKMIGGKIVGGYKESLLL